MVFPLFNNHQVGIFLTQRGKSQNQPCNSDHLVEMICCLLDPGHILVLILSFGFILELGLHKSIFPMLVAKSMPFLSIN